MRRIFQPHQRNSRYGIFRRDKTFTERRKEKNLCIHHRAHYTYASARKRSSTAVRCSPEARKSIEKRLSRKLLSNGDDRRVCCRCQRFTARKDAVFRNRPESGFFIQRIIPSQSQSATPWKDSATCSTTEDAIPSTYRVHLPLHSSLTMMCASHADFPKTIATPEPRIRP